MAYVSLLCIGIHEANARPRQARVVTLELEHARRHLSLHHRYLTWCGELDGHELLARVVRGHTAQ